MRSLRKVAVFWGVVLAFVLGFFCTDIALAAPSITFAPGDTIIPIGSTTTLNWDVTDATSCSASGDWSGVKALSGSEGTGALTEGTKSFTLTCEDIARETAAVTVSVTVADPPTLDFAPVSSEIDYNTPARLIWSSGRSTACEKYGDWSGATGLTGDETTENLISEKTFGISCSGPGGVVDKTVTISISNPMLQVELDFVADNSFIDWNEEATLRWNVSNADYCTASDGWSGDRDKDSGSYRTARLVDNTTYSLYCANSSGSSVRKNITIVVAPRERRPVTVTATADDLTIEYNTPATINWTSVNGDYCRVYDGSWTGNLPANGSYTSDNLVNNKVFIVRCYSWSDTGESPVSIEVGPNPAPVPTLNFSSSAVTLDYNTGTELDWSVTDTHTLTASGAWSGSKVIPTGSESTGDLTENKRYTLTATGDGGVITDNVDVSVGDPTFPPDVSLAADDLTVAYNQPTVIRWSSEHADWCRLRYDTTDEAIGADGNRHTGNLIADRTYTVECGNVAGSRLASLTVQVIPVGFPPEITLIADTNPVAYGTGTTIRWTSTNARVCSLSGVGGVSLNGSRETGNLYLPITYSLICTGDGGTTSRNLTINITGTPGEVPSINFWADDYNFYGNGSTTLHWSMTDADRCWASAGPWSGDKAVPTGDEVTVNPTATTRYEISCENVNGIVSDSLVITIDEANAVELEFYADNTEVEKNSYVTLTWNGKNANWCESYSDDRFANWDRYQRQVAGREASKTVGPITRYSTRLLLRCWNYTSHTDWRRLYITAGEHPPSITMSAPSLVAYNSPATISWYADYAESCRAWASPAEVTWSGSRATSGLQLTSNLTASTYFYLECTNSEGESTRVYKRVGVGSSLGIVPQIEFTSDKYLATEGEEYTVNWNVTDASWCSAVSEPSGLWMGAKDRTAGSETLEFSGDRQELVLICGNSRGSMAAIVKINKGGTELNVPSISFWADQMSLPINGRTILRWRVENAESCVASNGWTGTKAAGGGQEQTPVLSSSARFELTCTNAAGNRTAVVDVVVGGPPPGVSINFNASRYDVAAGDSTTLSWTAENAAYCYAVDPNGVFIGGKTTVGSEVLIPAISTTYKLVCGNDGGEVTATVPITVAKVIVCPNPARIINLGNTLQLTAWFKQDADAAFSCADTSGAIDVTNGHNGFSTSWSSANDGVATVNASGLATGIDYTETHGGPISVMAEYKEAKGFSAVHVVPPPVTCWKCTESKTCQSEITFPVDGQCPAGAYDSMHECAKSCRNPVDWQETGS